MLVAFGIRLGFLLSDEQPSELRSLSGTQGEVARNIVSHGIWGKLNLRAPTAAIEARAGHLVDPSDIDYRKADSHPDYQPLALHTEGVAFIEAALWKITGDQDYIWIQVLQVILAALLTVVIYRISLRLFDRPGAALAAAAIYAGHFALASFMRLPFYDPWAVLVVPAVFALFLKARDSGGRLPWLVAVGVCAGVGLNFRPAIGLLPLFLGAALVPALGARRAARLALVPFAIALVFMVPWTVRNAVEFHRFIPIHTGFGQVLWQGLGEIHNDFGAKEDDASANAIVRRERPGLVYGTPAYDDFLRDRALRSIRDHPGFYAKLVAYRVVKATVLMRKVDWAGKHSKRFASRSGSPLSFAVKHPVDALIAAWAAIAEPLLFLIALVTLIATWRRFRDQHLLLLAAVIGTILVPVLIGEEWRYVAPSAFVWIVLGGLGVDSAMRAVRARARSLPAATT